MMLDKQELRNALSEIEDTARRERLIHRIHRPELANAYNLIVQLTQIVRENIVQ